MATFNIIRTNKGYDKMIQDLSGKIFIAFDIETTGVGRHDTIIGFSIATGVDNGHYVILQEWDNNQKKLIELETSQRANEFFTLLKNKHLVCHNGIFDCRFVEANYNVSLIQSLHTDTMILGHLLDENRSNGLKELAVTIFGEDSKKEQAEMKASVVANGGVLTKQKYEMYKADSTLMAKYGCQDAILTLKLFYHLTDQLFEQKLDTFFFEESMPMFRGPTYDLNTIGLRVDPIALSKLKGELEAQCLEAKAFILSEISEHIKDKYPGTSPKTTFNIGSNQQLSWLLFEVLGREFNTLTGEGKLLCKALNLKLPYAANDKRTFLHTIRTHKGRIWAPSAFNPKTKKMSKAKVIGDMCKYLACDKTSMAKYAKQYKWVERFLEYTKNKKILTTYVNGIQNRMTYNIIHPSFLQHGTTSGRYASRDPNFQNLPRKDKRIKSCIVARPGKTFVGADYSQLEPRVFASFSQDTRLMQCFETGDDFYSIIGAEIFQTPPCSMNKEAEGSFAKKYPNERDVAKAVALAATYGTTAPKLSHMIGKTMNEAQGILDNYFASFSNVRKLMEDTHALAKQQGFVSSFFGRLRRMPIAMEFDKMYGNTPHHKLPYEARTMLNLAMNHTIQSTGASIVNRAAIAFWNKTKEHAIANCYIVMQVHDELIVECEQHDATFVALLLQEAMENTVELPGVRLIAEPKIATNLADLK